MDQHGQFVRIWELTILSQYPQETLTHPLELTVGYVSVLCTLREAMQILIHTVYVSDMCEGIVVHWHEYHRKKFAEGIATFNSHRFVRCFSSHSMNKIPAFRHLCKCHHQGNEDKVMKRVLNR